MDRAAAVEKRSLSRTIKFPSLIHGTERWKHAHSELTDHFP